MKQALSVVGRALFRALTAAIVIYGFGVGDAPDLNRTYLIGVATLIGLVAAAVSAVAHYKTTFSFVTYIGEPFGEWADSFVQAFLGSLAVTLPGMLGAPNLGAYRALGASALVGAANAGVRALQGSMTEGEWPAAGRGVNPPAKT